MQGIEAPSEIMAPFCPSLPIAETAVAQDSVDEELAGHASEMGSHEANRMHSGQTESLDGEESQTSLQAGGHMAVGEHHGVDEKAAVHEIGDSSALGAGESDEQPQQPSTPEASEGSTE